jgi:molybdopterin converting factor small subunit
LRYWASARAAAGLEEDLLEVSGAVSLASLRERARALHAGSRRFSDVIDTCSVLLDDRPVGSSDPASVLVRAGQTVEFLPPFAGG